MKKLTLFGFLFVFVTIGLYLNTSARDIQANTQQNPEVKAEAQQASEVSSEEGDTLNEVVSLKAEMWEYNPNIIRLKKGQPVTINLNNIDFAHGIIIPDLELGGMETLTFTPEEAGEFEFFCPVYCGAGHGNMRGKIIVE